MSNSNCMYGTAFRPLRGINVHINHDVARLPKICGTINKTKHHSIVQKGINVDSHVHLIWMYWFIVITIFWYTFADVWIGNYRVSIAINCKKSNLGKWIRKTEAFVGNVVTTLLLLLLPFGTGVALLYCWCCYYHHHIKKTWMHACPNLHLWFSFHFICK